MKPTSTLSGESSGNAPAVPASLRKWPALAIAALVGFAITVPTWLAPGTMFQFFAMMVGPLGGAALFVLWWLFASRRPSLAERCGGLVFLLIGSVAAALLVDESIRFGLMIHGSASVILAVTLWFYAAQSWPWRGQLLGAAAMVVLVLGFWCTLRSDGVDGTVTPDYSWRWSPTKEQQYVASLEQRSSANAASTPAEQGRLSADQPAAGPVSPLELSVGDWPGFRGAQRDGRVAGVRVETDWDTHPPRELWRRPLGPAWSSFAVIGDHLYTQEQRQDEEVVLCLSAASGEQLWAHTNPTRFWEAMAGPGPRATPTFDRGRIYALGANGTLDCLDAKTGEPYWSAQLTEDADVKVPMWGFASSPLVVGEAVMVYAGGGPGRGVVAFDRERGELLWQAGSGTHSYSSPQPAVFSGEPQVLMLTDHGVFSLLPTTGQLLWNHDWPFEDMNRTVQPNVDGDRVYLGTGFGMGTRAISIRQQEGSWQASEEWTSTALKPYYNDFVIHEDHLYGFDGNIFTCVEASSGKRLWKRGRYGNGQVLLLAEQGLLLVLSEQGDVVLLQANPERHQELAQVSAIQGKTWNHPVLARDRLFVRNAEEAACFVLQTK